jgi:hypothetical protein
MTARIKTGLKRDDDILIGTVIQHPTQKLKPVGLITG